MIIAQKLSKAIKEAKRIKIKYENKDNALKTDLKKLIQ